MRSGVRQGCGFSLSAWNAVGDEACWQNELAIGAYGASPMCVLAMQEATQYDAVRNVASDVTYPMLCKNRTDS
jgi:hypothetical protein